jgi:hypothetical protein
MLFLMGADPSKKSNSARLLNDRVDEITKAKVAESKEKGTPLGPEFVAAQRPTSLLQAGLPVYNDDRWMIMPILLGGLAVFWAASCAAQYGFSVMVIAFLLNYVFYDLYSGILHLCLDHPDNISAPILGQACLEFQWHHHIPDDIVVKGLFESIADLNLATCLVYSIQFCASGFGTDKLVLGCTGIKACMGHFGQFSHLSSHTRLANRSTFVQWLQDQSLMASVKSHHKHHTMPHDTEFCLLGVCNPILNRLIKYKPPFENPRFYAGLFVAWSVFDVVVMCRIVRFLAPCASSSSL